MAAAERPPARPRPADLPSWECPAPRGGIPDGAIASVSTWLGERAEVLCEGDLNGNRRDEVLAASTIRTFGKGIGFYRVITAAAIFEEGEDRRAAWPMTLLVTDRVENAAGLIGWREPPGPGSVGLRVTMTDGGNACVQLRRLDGGRHSLEEPLLLVRWDSSVARWVSGSCRDGTAGTPVRAGD